MPAFTVSYSSSLLELVRFEGFCCDGVEVGPYCRPDEIAQVSRDLPGWRVELHASYLGLMPFTRGALNAYLKSTRSRWISCHVRLLSALELRLALRWRIFLPILNPRQRIQGLLAATHRLKEWAPLPVILENMPCSHPRHRLETDPRITSEILDAAGCDLLLDLAHARVGAAHFDLAVVDYLAQLPLKKVRQVHLSGPRWRNGYLYDAHEPMTDEDYSLLEWTLAHADPEVVTLEYFRDKDALREQLRRLKTII